MAIIAYAKGNDMKRMLIKTYLILTIIYLAGNLSKINSYDMGETLRFNVPVIILIYLVPGLISGLILNYEMILKFMKSKSRKFDQRFILFLIFMLIVASYPMLVYYIPRSSFDFIDFAFVISAQFQFTVGLLMGYFTTQALTTQD